MDVHVSLKVCMGPPGLHGGSGDLLINRAAGGTVVHLVSIQVSASSAVEPDRHSLEKGLCDVVTPSK